MPQACQEQGLGKESISVALKKQINLQNTKREIKTKSKKLIALKRAEQVQRKENNRDNWNETKEMDRKETTHLLSLVTGRGGGHKGDIIQSCNLETI